MALNGDTLGTAIKTAIMSHFSGVDTSAWDTASIEDIWQVIATAVVTHLNENANILPLPADGASTITSTVDQAETILIKADAGSSETIKIKSDHGTSVTDGAEAISISAASGAVGIRSTANLANCINITADGGTTSSIRIHNDHGSSTTEGAESIALISDIGGIGLRSTANSANCINLTADGGSDSTISIYNDQGTANTDGASSVQVTSDDGRVELLSGMGTAKSLYLHADGGTSESIYLHASQGTGQGAITLHTPAGGSYVLANKANAYAVMLDNNGNNANRYVIKAQGGANSGAGTTHYFNCFDGDGDNVGTIKNVSGTFQLSDVSDRRIKTDIVDTEINGLEIIENIQVRDFTWEKNGLRCTAGLVAQELQEAYPPAASGSEDEVDPETGETVYMTVSRDVLVPVLIKAVQELTDRVEQLEQGS